MASTPGPADVEAQQPKHAVSHIQLVLNPGGVTQDVINHTYPGMGTPESPFVIDFLPIDARNPMQLPDWKKWTITVLQAFATLAVAFVSSAFSGGIYEVIRDFQVEQIVAIAGVSLFVFGFAVGPLIWAPLSGTMTE